MSPLDYKKSAKKHLEFCQRWEVKSQEDSAIKDVDLLEIYYLLGYAAECLTVYTIYRFGPWAPTGDERNRFRLKYNIDEFYDPVFTKETEYDFFNESTPSKRKQRRSVDGGEIEKTIIEKTIMNTEIKEKRRFNTQHHKFQKAIEGVIVSKLLKESALNNVDFYNNYSRDKSGGILLLKEWDTALRYCHNKEKWEERKGVTSNLLNKANVQELIDSLFELYKQLDNIH